MSHASLAAESVAPVWSAPLKALAPLYGLTVAARGTLYDHGWLAARRAPVPVVSVGNLTAGGSGKSPMVAWIASELARAGKRPAVVSRGYGGSHRGPATIVSAGQGARVGPEVAGDEPVMLAGQLPGVPVIVARRRLEGAKLAADRLGARCVVLDDGFQHRALARDLDLVMLDGADPFGNEKLLPLGPLREPLAALRRAQAVVVYGGVDGADPESGAWETIRRAASAHCPGVPILTAGPTAAGVLDPASGSIGKPESLGGRTVVLLAGIARPERFFRLAEALGARALKRFAFADHHRFTEADLKTVADAARSSRADYILTTRKDLARLGPAAGGLPSLRALAVDVEVREADLLRSLLRGACP